MVQRATKPCFYVGVHFTVIYKHELIKFSSVFGSKYKQKINAHLHSNQQTYKSCANMQIKIIIFPFGQILSRCFTILSRQCIHHRKGNFICYSLSTTIKSTAVFSKQDNVTFSVIYKRAGGPAAASNRTSRYIFAKINVQTTILNLV